MSQELEAPGQQNALPRLVAWLCESFVITLEALIPWRLL
jgi:hypothetical protein